jgi:SET domain-containing protein
MKTSLYIRKVSGKGRGVFSKVAIPRGALIEECPLIVLPGEDFDIISSTRMVDYSFFFDREKGELAIALGFGSLYNHSLQPNAGHEVNPEKKVMTFYALRDIKGGEEICINYAGESEEDPLKWFTDRKIVFRP